MLSGEMAMKVWATNRWSPSKARSAAFWPAASPSNVKITSPANVSLSTRYRRSSDAWSEPKAVPHVATAVVTPARCAAITSVYPSTTTTCLSLPMSRRARSMP